MRVFETNVQELKNGVLRAVARLAWKDDLQTSGAHSLDYKR